MDHGLLCSDEVVTKKRARTTSRSELSAPKQKHELDDQERKDNEMKKSMHREIERQRRQEMSNLYASLRELLPLEFIKGKRSVSDHMHEAANYIKHMEKNIQELKLRREKLKKESNYFSAASENGVNLLNSVTVNYCCDGVEVLMMINSCASKEGFGFSLSRVFAELTQKGLDIITCFSNKMNDRIFYKIHTEINAFAYIDLSELQKALLNVINQDSWNLLGVDFS